jgi:cytochrome b pre-mRNA-processing protein 3
VPDTLEGRFELMTVFATLALVRLRADPGAGALAQHFTDVLFRNVDSGLREAGVGDLTVPKKMRKLAGAFYGRLDAYAGPLAAKDAPALAEAVSRNIGVSDAFAPALARLALETAATQADRPVTALLAVDGWPAPAA